MAHAGALSPDRSHVLPDGRALGWSEYGRTDGAPVFYFHGIPGSRIDGRVVADVIADAGLRVIAADRPGFGRSTYAGKRTYGGWVADVESLAGALGIDRFSILAYSCGGPYALAAAAALPDRVAGVAIVSGVAPAEMPGYRDGLCQTDRIMTWLAPRAPWLARPLVARSLKLARDRPNRFVKEAGRDFKATADRSLIDAGFGSLMPELFLEAGRGGPAGIVEDFAVWGRASGLRLQQVTGPVRLWHGANDRTVPISHSRWIASQLPSAELTAWPDTGHLHTPERWAQVYAALA